MTNNTVKNAREWAASWRADVDNIKDALDDAGVYTFDVKQVVMRASQMANQLETLAYELEVSQGMENRLLYKAAKFEQAYNDLKERALNTLPDAMYRELVQD